MDDLTFSKNAGLAAPAGSIISSSRPGRTFQPRTRRAGIESARNASFQSLMSGPATHGCGKQKGRTHSTPSVREARPFEDRKCDNHIAQNSGKPVSRNSSAAKAAIRRSAFGDPLQCCDMEELVMSMLLNGAVNSACVQERVLHVRCKAIPKLEPKSLSQIEVVNLAYRNMPVNTFLVPLPSSIFFPCGGENHLFCAVNR